jgi:hypothetical protein
MPELWLTSRNLPLPSLLIQQMSDGSKGVRVAIAPLLVFFGAAPDVFFEVPIEITRNNQVQPSVTVIIEKGRARRPSSARHSGPLGYVLKGSIALVVVELIAAEARHVEVW